MVQICVELKGGREFDEKLVGFNCNYGLLTRLCILGDDKNQKHPPRLWEAGRVFFWETCHHTVCAVCHTYSPPARVHVNYEAGLHAARTIVESQNCLSTYCHSLPEDKALLTLEYEETLSGVIKQIQNNI